MKTAANGGLMFVNAMWHGVATTYGFQFDSPLDVARFIDCLYLGLKDWFWALERPPVRVYSMAPYSTISARYAQAHAYSASAKATSKQGAGDANFWGRLLAARVYFSGLADEINYITAYPGHAPTSKPTVIADALNILGQCLRKSYRPDLFIRHAMAVKSQTARSRGGSVDVENQLRTIMLNRAPTRGVGGDAYKSMPLKPGKTVLLVDDICTQGHSFEAGRSFIGATGAETICLSWLKTINTDYNMIDPTLRITDPYVPQVKTNPIRTIVHRFDHSIRSTAAPKHLADLHQRYFSWKWPLDI